MEIKGGWVNISRDRRPTRDDSAFPPAVENGNG
jgi:hypothetical protein